MFWFLNLAVAGRRGVEEINRKMPSVRKALMASRKPGPPPPTRLHPPASTQVVTWKCTVKTITNMRFWESIIENGWEWEVVGEQASGSRWQNSSFASNYLELSHRRWDGINYQMSAPMSSRVKPTLGCYHRLGTGGPRHFLHFCAQLASQCLAARSLGLIQEQNGESVF